MELLSLKVLFGVLSYIFLVEGVDRNGKWLKQEHLQGMLPNTLMRNITELTSRSLIDCLDKCLSANSCVSAFYNKDFTDPNCFLHDYIRTNTRLMTSDPNGVYYVRDDVYPDCPVGEEYETRYITVRLTDNKLFTFRIYDNLRLTYDLAVQHCERDSASLMHVSSGALRLWLATNLDVSVDPSTILIDASNQFAEDPFNTTQWVSSDGLAFNVTYWSASEPYSPDTLQCAVAEKGGSIGAFPCTDEEEFICEM